jgi:hypothetical protein
VLSEIFTAVTLCLSIVPMDCLAAFVIGSTSARLVSIFRTKIGPRKEILASDMDSSIDSDVVFCKYPLPGLA